MLSKILGDSIKSKVLGKGSKLEGVSVESKTSPVVAVLNITAKNFILLPTIARDVNVARQAMIALVKLAGGKSTNKADAHMLKASERSKKFEVKRDGPTLENEDGLGNFLKKKVKKSFKKWFKKTRLGKAIRRMKIGMKKMIRKFKKMGLRMLKKIFNKALFKRIFSPKNIAKLLFKLLRVAGPIGLVITVVGAAVNGFIDAWKTYQETGDLWETYKAYLGGILDFATFGLIDKDTLDNLEDSIKDLWEPISESITKFKDDMLEWIDNKWTSFTDWFTGTNTLKPDKKDVKPEESPNNPSESEIKKQQKEAKVTMKKLLQYRQQLKMELSLLQYDLKVLDAELEAIENDKPANIPPKPTKGRVAPAPAPSKPAEKPAVTPAPAPATSSSPSAAGAQNPSGGMSGMAGALAAELGKYGITNIFAKQAIVATAAKESNLNPAAKEDGAQMYLKTLAKRGLEYIYKVFPQLKPGGRVAKDLGYPNGVPADYLQAEWSKGDEAFFDSVYGGLNTNPQKGDAYKYRGRGFVGITGRTIYDGVGKQVGLDLVNNPDAVGSNFQVASGALAGYMFMTRGGKEKALQDLNSLPDFTSALKYTLRTVAGLGHKESEFDKEGSHLQEQFRKASQFQNLAASSTSGPPPSASGAQVAQSSAQVAQGQREQLKPTDANVINVQKTKNTQVAVDETTTKDTKQGNHADKLVGRAA